ncbi:hypothetical protein F5882DRAFT_97703 [Hyaloscypha sp. PMI_1271]|nr:hypothetical protein F5882DRAFT_97703 [Hyaloscypha sp. PMI_1271]
MARPYIFFTLLAFIVSALAASPPSFCKCTCFANSTIIPLSTHSSTTGNTPRAAGTTCNTCNKAFCLAQHLPICKNAEEKDVFTTCFQRDSRKDQIVVLTFIGVTIGLLGWAAVRKAMERREGEGVRIAGTQEGYERVGGRR